MRTITKSMATAPTGNFSAAGLPDPARVILQAAGRLRWLELIQGVLALAAGVLVLVYPDRSLTVLTIVFGIYLILLSPLRLALALTVPGLSGGERGLEAVLSVFALIAGIIVVVDPGAGLLGVALAFGIYLLAAGTIRLYMGVTERDNRVWRIVTGILDLAAGTIVIAYPDIGLTALAVILGIYLLVRGVFDLWLAWALNRVAHAVR
jgi:uncharacterized membrane protein HdeD (DUF308 family)